jgi:hypothetical protein
MPRVRIIADPFDLATYAEYNTDDMLGLLHEHFPVWPETGRVYHDVISIENDVTPRSEDQVQALAEAQADDLFYVVVYPGDPVTAIITVVATLALTAAVLLFLTPKIPKADNSDQSSNNTLGQRTNKPRPNSRVEDVFGDVISVPTLLSVPLVVFDNNIQVEYCYMSVGRGSYYITDVKDGDTPIGQIAGAGVRFYGPGTSPNSGAPFYSIGTPITQPLLNIIKQNEVNGQSLRSPNANSVQGANDIRFVYPDTIERTGTAVDFTKFAAGDVIEVASSSFTGASGSKQTNTQASYTSAGTVVFSTLNPTTFFTVGQSVTISGAGYSGPTTAGGTLYVDLSGTYVITALNATTMTLSSPNSINSDWGKLTQYTGSATVARNGTFSVPTSTNGYNLAGSYTVLASSTGSLTLANPAAVNAAWNNVQGLPGGATEYASPVISSSGIQWAGPFVLNMTDLTQVIANFYAPQGMYRVTSKGKNRPASVQVQLEVTPVDAAGVVSGAAMLFTATISGDGTDKRAKGVTCYANVPVGRCQVRARRLTPTDYNTDDTILDEVQWRDGYGTAPLTVSDFGDVTTVYTRTYATAGASSVKERKLNCRAARKVLQRNPGKVDILKDFNAALPAGSSVARASVGSRNNSANVLEMIAANLPRFEYDAAQARTNFVPNSEFAGWTVGPWVNSASAQWTVPAGMSRSIVAVGNDAQGAYADVRIFGTNTSGARAAPHLYLRAATQTPATAGESWTASINTQVVAGDPTGVLASYRVMMQAFTSAGAYVADLGGPASGDGPTSATKVLAATIGQISLAIPMSIAIGATVDLTLRIRKPQLEMGSAVTAYIPTTGTIASTAPFKGLLLEPAATNLIPAALQAPTAGNQMNRAAATDPSGGNTASRFTMTGTTDPQAQFVVPTAPSGRTFTKSSYNKYVATYGLAGRALLFDYGQQGAEAAASTSVTLTPSWTRGIGTRTFPAGMTSTTAVTRIDPFDGTGGTNTPTAGASIDTAFWMYEEGPVATSYIPAGQTRAADVLTIDWGSNFSGTYNVRYKQDDNSTVVVSTNVVNGQSTVSAADLPRRLLRTATLLNAPIGPPTWDGSFQTELAPSTNAGDIICHMALDPYIGGRSLEELDVAQIYNTVDDVVSYFGMPDAGQFSYTFDQDNISFEEMVQTVAKAIFCTAYRQGSIHRLFFEQQTDATDAILLFNHRNKTPGSEQRTVRFGRLNDYDGVELDYISATDGAKLTLYIPEDQSATKPKKVEMLGVIDRRGDAAVATLHAMRAWNKIQYQHTTTQFTALSEASQLVLTQRVEVTDNTRPDTIDGEVTGLQGLVLGLSQPFNPVAGKQYTIFLQMSSGGLDTRVCTAGPDEMSCTLQSAPTQALVTSADASALTTYQIVASDNARPSGFLISEKGAYHKGEIPIQAINYDDRYYQADQTYKGT